MTTPQQRVFTPDPDDVEVREVSDESDDDGFFRIRMPITSTAEARDGIAFERSKVEGFRDQIESERIPIFLDHGRNPASGSRYSALGKVGYLDEAALEENDGVTDLVADFVVVDPDELNEGTGLMREALSWLRHQADLGLPLASSIGWSDDTGDRDLPGGSDLMEASIVGIPSDARTSTASAEPATLARAVSAASDDFDVDAFAREFRAIEREHERDATDPDQADRDEDDMTDDTTDEPDEQSGTDDRDEQSSDNEWRSEMLEMQRQQTETLSTLAEALRQEDDEDDEEEEDEDGENAADDDVGERTVILDGEERTIDEALTQLREAAEDADAGEADSKTENRAADDTETVDDDGDDTTAGFGFAGVEDLS